MSQSTLTAEARRQQAAALKLAAATRASVRKRSVDLDAALSTYDDATTDLSATPEDEAKAAAHLMKVVARTDEEHRLRRADAWGEFAAATNAGSRAA